MEAAEAGEAAKDDLLGVLMDSNMKETRQASGMGMSLQEVIDECKQDKRLLRYYWFGL